MISIQKLRGGRAGPRVLASRGRLTEAVEYHRANHIALRYVFRDQATMQTRREKQRKLPFGEEKSHHPSRSVNNLSRFGRGRSWCWLPNPRAQPNRGGGGGCAPYAERSPR